MRRARGHEGLLLNAALHVGMTSSNPPASTGSGSCNNQTGVLGARSLTNRLQHLKGMRECVKMSEACSSVANM